MGGAVGAVLRFSVSALLNQVATSSFPWGTLSVNLIGSFVLALLVSVTGGEQNAWYFFLAVGVLGAFTTFSTFSVETFNLINTAGLGMGILNMVANLVGGLGLALSGYLIGNLIK